MTAHFILTSPYGLASLLRGALAQRAVNQILDELDAAELQQPRALLFPAVERHAHLPGPREHLLVLDCSFVVQVIGARRRNSFDDVQLVAVEVAGAIEPAEI